MASQDIYVRKDVYEADQRALIAEIRLGNNELLRVIRDELGTFKTEMREELDTFKTEINEKFDSFKKDVDARFDRVDERLDKLETRVDALETRVGSLETKVDNLETKVDKLDKRVGALETKTEVLITRVKGIDDRISDSHNFMMIGFALIGFLVAFAVFVQPLAKFFRNWFKPAVTLEQIEELINAKLENRANPLP